MPGHRFVPVWFAMRDLCRPSTVSILDNFSALYGRSSIGSQVSTSAVASATGFCILCFESFRGIRRAQEFAMLRHGAGRGPWRNKSVWY